MFDLIIKNASIVDGSEAPCFAGGLAVKEGKIAALWHGGVPDNCAVNVISAEDGKLRLIVDDAIYYDPALSRNPYKQYR